MKILALDTARKSSDACFFDTSSGREITASRAEKNNEALFLMLQSVLQEAGATLDTLDALCVCRGPGSFTGLRIGMTTMRTFAQIKNLPVYGINTLDAIRTMADADVIPLLDARGGRVYCPGDAPGTTQLSQVDVLSKKPQYVSFTSPQLQEALGDRKVLWWPEDTLLSPVIARLGVERLLLKDPGDWRSLLPEYVGVSQAERERKKKEAGR
ncbi:MAG: tRNA (adenosine(37)-N6)-threonylcarbamoyltransferase complex dimerization subunit type 1 TsaB [Peptoniphilaceae bacterium]|jgi:tRNA threonylcarbamoyl adenosine modification protein YeaZ